MATITWPYSGRFSAEVITCPRCRFRFDVTTKTKTDTETEAEVEADGKGGKQTVACPCCGLEAELVPRQWKWGEHTPITDEERALLRELCPEEDDDGQRWVSASGRLPTTHTLGGYTWVDIT